MPENPIPSLKAILTLPKPRKAMLSADRLEISDHAGERLPRRPRVGTDRRADERCPVTAYACLSTKPGGEVRGRLEDLSIYGCSLQLQTRFFKVGDLIWFKVDPIEQWRGYVRWINGDKIGVEFERPFYEPVFDQLVRINQAVECRIGV